MAKTMNPSIVTPAQIGRICDLLTAGLRKASLKSIPVQRVIETEGGPLTDELVAVVCKYVEAVIDPIVRVDRSIKPVYPEWVQDVLHPELEAAGPAEYNISDVEQWLHDGQKNGGWVKGQVIFDHLEETGDLKNHSGLRDLEEIQKKGIKFFRKYFQGKAVFGWKSVVRSSYGGLHVPCLCEGSD